MSTNISNLKLEKSFENVLNGLTRTQAQGRAMQPQGSQALNVEVIWGYRVLDVPPNADIVATTSIDVEAVDPSKIVIATILHSTFVKYTNGTLINADLESHEIGDDVYRVWLNYDGRSDMGEYWLVPGPTTKTIDEIMLETAGSSSIPHHKARVTFAVYRLDDVESPASLDQYLIFFQVRMIIG